jgi:hypothetical protein
MCGCLLLFGQFGIAQNDIVFNSARCAQLLQVIHKATHWINIWSFLLPKNQRVPMNTRYTCLMTIVRVIFSRNG